MAAENAALAGGAAGPAKRHGERRAAGWVKNKRTQPDQGHASYADYQSLEPQLSSARSKILAGGDVYRSPCYCVGCMPGATS